MIYTVFVEFNKDFIEIDGRQIKVGVKSRPIGGAANKEIVKKIAKKLGLSSQQVYIKSGARSKIKIVEINYS